MIKLLKIAAVAWLLTGAAAFAQTQDMAVTPNTAAPPRASIKLVRVIWALPTGANWANLTNSLFGFCSSGVGVTRTWAGGRESQELAPYSARFKAELEKAGYKVVTPGEDNVFDAESGSADYEAAAVITDIALKGCIAQDPAIKGAVKGQSVMRVDWQIYSPIRKQVVAHISTSGKAASDRFSQGGGQTLIVDSFAANAMELPLDADFRAALSAPKPASKGVLLPDQQRRIALIGNLRVPKRHISDAVGSVVTILTGAGSGSGVLLSDDGYLLTNAHVVGDEKQVRVRWSDGIETLGEVTRIAKGRDVAIVKTSSRDRTPLAVKRGPLNPGQRVYAIGSPRGKDFQGTVSSGVVSASRIFEGLRYIQSDVSVSPGSSGGALLDETGSLIGITVAGVDNVGRAGLNLFIPIGDAMDFLSLDPQ